VGLSFEAAQVEGLAMLNRILSALVLVTFGLAPVEQAQGQVLGPSGQWVQASVGLTGGYDLSAMEKAARVADDARLQEQALYKTGVDALTAKDYAAAGRSFGDLLRRDPANADANFLMGLAEIGLQDWPAAKGYLEIATKLDVTRPEPKTRLGLTYVELGDIASAQKVRTDLAALDKTCKQTCGDAAWIADGVRLLDQRLAAAEASKVPAPSPTTVALSVAVAFKPADYGAATIHSLSDVYRLLAEDNRCPPGYKPEREEPCALIAYAPEEDKPGTYKQYYRPIFGVVSKNAIWTMIDNSMAVVSPKALWAPVEVENTMTRGVKDTYRALAVVGNRENLENCNQARACLPHKELFLHFRDLKALPRKFIEDYWGKPKMVDHGAKRYLPGTGP
jgi:hypothetical protein